VTIGTANLISAFVTGSVLPANTVDDLSLLLSRADDETLFDLYELDPPSAATSTLVNVGYIPLREGAVVTGDPSNMRVFVAPVRVVRSSISASTPRRILSAISSAATTVSMPAAPAAGKWRIELLYAQIAWTNASEPAAGASVTFAFATSPADAVTSGAANVATLPANTSSTWNVPLAYVKNINGATGINPRDVLDYTPAASGGTDGKLRRRVRGGGIDARRAYASGPQSVATLNAAHTEITSALTRPTVHKAGGEMVMRLLTLTKSMTGGTSGVTATVDVDDTRDWRDGTFFSAWNVPYGTAGLGQDSTATAIQYHAEEDTGTGVAGTRRAPMSTDVSGGANVPALYLQWGQSYETNDLTDAVAVRTVTGKLGTTASAVAGARPIVGAPYIAAADWLQLRVDISTGKLQLQRNIAGAAAGAPVTVLLVAHFSNSR